MSALVQHGRRAGQSRGNTPEFQMNGQGIGPGPKAGEQDLRQVAVLSKNDWDRIHYQLNKRAIEEERVRKHRAEREHLHDLSQKQVANWSNTIKARAVKDAGQRQKKLEARKQREEKNEEERKLIDIEEAKYQAAQRKEAIEKAKTQQYYQTDRVKKFHSALQLTEVLKEREAQLELKRIMSAAGKDVDEHYRRMENDEREKAILRDQQKAIRRIQQAKDTAVYQKSQMHDHLREADKLRQEDEHEGEELKRLAAQYELEKRGLEMIRQQEANQMMADNVRQIGDVQKMKKLNQMQEDEEDEECRIFAAAKRKMMKLRAEKEAQLHNDNQDYTAYSTANYILKCNWHASGNTPKSKSKRETSPTPSEKSPKSLSSKNQRTSCRHNRYLSTSSSPKLGKSLPEQSSKPPSPPARPSFSPEPGVQWGLLSDREKQERLERIREKLNAQIQQKQDDEEERMARAVAEAEAKRDKEEAEKELKMRTAFAEMADDRFNQMSQKEKQAAEERRKAKEELLVKKEADALFQRNEAEKKRRWEEREKGLHKFHSQQMGERKDKATAEMMAQLALDRKNSELVALEEKQFQEYATKVINHAEKGGRNTLPLRKAAREGAGGGLGPQFPGKGGVRPSYMTADQQGVQLPYYQRTATENTKELIQGEGRTDQRLGFVW